MIHLRTKLLLSMLAVVAVTTGVSALFTRRITQEELRRVQMREPRSLDLAPLERHFATTGSWDGVEAVLDRSRTRVLLATADHKILAVPRDLRTADVTLGADDRITIAHGPIRMVLQTPPERVAGALAYPLPNEKPQMPPAQALDRRLLLVFSAAALVAVVLSFLLSRSITRSVERLTTAVQTMTRGGRAAHVEVRGRDEIAQLARSFNDMGDALASHEDLRRRMVSDVAHELRTPLTNLRCELEAIQDGLAAADPSRIASLHDEVLHLGRLVDDLQDLALAESGGLQLQRGPLDLHALAAHVIDRFAAEAERRSISLSVSGERVEVEGDATRVAQIIRNLVSNAFRHTPDGGAIRVRVTPHSDHVSLVVEDSGSGIPEGELERIFERFYRVDEARTRERGGAGLGLAIVRRLVELHGGRVWAENGSPGARFTVTLPIQLLL